MLSRLAATVEDAVVKLQVTSLRGQAASIIVVVALLPALTVEAGEQVHQHGISGLANGGLGGSGESDNEEEGEAGKGEEG